MSSRFVWGPDERLYRPHEVDECPSCKGVKLINERVCVVCELREKRERDG